MPFTLIIENLQFKQQRLDLHFFCRLLEWQRCLVGNLGMDVIYLYYSFIWILLSQYLCSRYQLPLFCAYYRLSLSRYKKLDLYHDRCKNGWRMTICIIFLLRYMVNTESKDEREREREAMQNQKYFIILCGFVHVLVILTIMDWSVELKPTYLHAEKG